MAVLKPGAFAHQSAKAFVGVEVLPAGQIITAHLVENQQDREARFAGWNHLSFVTCPLLFLRGANGYGRMTSDKEQSSQATKGQASKHP
jgi:hypothetical protein